MTYNDQIVTRKVSVQVEIEYNVINRYGEMLPQEDTDKMAVGLAVSPNFHTITDGVSIFKVEIKGEDANGNAIYKYGDSSTDRMV